MCNLNCFHCQYEDCINDQLTAEEYKLSKSLDKEIKDSGLDKSKLAKKMANRRYREKHRDILRAKDRERYIGERREKVIETSRDYNIEHGVEINKITLMNYYKRKEENAS